MSKDIKSAGVVTADFSQSVCDSTLVTTVNVDKLLLFSGETYYTLKEYFQHIMEDTVCGKISGGIVTCANCIYHDSDGEWCFHFEHVMGSDDYCSYGEPVCPLSRSNKEKK